MGAALFSAKCKQVTSEFDCMYFTKRFFSQFAVIHSINKTEISVHIHAELSNFGYFSL